MKRHTVIARSDLAERAEEMGFTYRQIDGADYWDESAYYSFSLTEIEDQLETPTNELAALCLDLVEIVVRDVEKMLLLDVPREAMASIVESWDRGDPTLYGRFDLAFDGTRPAKLLECNADTPTSLFESAVFQWFWLEDLKRLGTLPSGTDQFNSLHEALIERWGKILQGSPLWLASMPNDEDQGTIRYLAECAQHAGSSVDVLAMRDIGLKGYRFVDRRGRWIKRLFKLYPWEWMLADPFGRSPAMKQTRFVEPPWKMLLSSKAILPLLWRMAPSHPNLLPTFFDDEPDAASLGNSFIRKPVHSREGCNITIVKDGTVITETGGSYGHGRYVRQALAETNDFDGNHPVIGSWIVGGEARGLGIREDVRPVSSNLSRFIPHVIEA